MPEIFTNIVEKIKEFWSKLDKSQKKRIYITSSIVAITVAAALIALTRPTYATVVSNASQKEIGEMSAVLNENGIWNKISEDGTGIIVNSRDNSKAQIALAEKGYPKGGLTFEDAINMIGITTTESDKKQIWKQQQANEIAKKLCAHDNIEYAEVSLAIPDDTVFLTSNRTESKPTAYVMVKPVTVLTEEQVQGIVMLVSKSVEKLEPENVVVVDNNLYILNRSVPDNDISALSTQEELLAKKARELEEKVYSYFSVGQIDSFDTLRVVATPVLDFDRVKTQSKLITNPEGMDSGAIISSQERNERAENVAEDGAPGMDTNPGEANAPTYQLYNNNNSSYKSEEITQNFGYDETIKEEEKAIGYLVAEKSTMAISLWYGKRVTDESSLTDDLIEQVRTAASKATGIPIENISVNKYKLAPQETVEKSTVDIIEELIKDYGLFIILVLLILGMIISILLSFKQKVETEEILTEPIVDIAMEDEIPREEEFIGLKLDDKSEMQKQIDKFAEEKPELVAKLIKSWLADKSNY
jgi:flagellar M-ring protein FliF